MSLSSLVNLIKIFDAFISIVIGYVVNEPDKIDLLSVEIISRFMVCDPYKFISYAVEKSVG